jgi:hypothetical protein
MTIAAEADGPDGTFTAALARFQLERGEPNLPPR